MLFALDCTGIPFAEMLARATIPPLEGLHAAIGLTKAARRKTRRAALPAVGGAGRMPPALTCATCVNQLDVDRQLDLVANRDAAGLERLIPRQTEVAATELRRMR